MKKSNLYGLLPTVAAALALMLSTSCGENDTPTPKPEPKPGPNPAPEEAVHHYAFAANVDNAFYITTFEDFKEGLKTNFKGAIKLASGHLFIEKFGDYVYMQSGSMYGQGGEQTLYKYALSKTGRLSEKPVAQLAFPGSPNVVEIIFASETKAYAVTTGSRGQLIVINPSTMTVVKEIDLSAYAEGDNDPDGGNGIVRDGKLFLPLNQAKSMQEILPTAAQIAVIDVATDRVEKVIKDERATSLGMVGHTCPVTDEAGNIYFYTGPRSAMMAQFMPGKGYKDGLLRIKKGETDFDKDFYMSLQTANGGEVGSYGLYMTYGGNGKIYLMLYKPSLVTEKDDPNMTKNRSFVPYEVDVRAKTGRVLPMPATTAWTSSAIIRVGNAIYFGEQTSEGIGFYRYDMTTGKGSNKPTVETPSGAYKVIAL
jgi:hypothetical protein